MLSKVVVRCDPDTLASLEPDGLGRSLVNTIRPLWDVLRVWYVWSEAPLKERTGNLTKVLVPITRR